MDQVRGSKHKHYCASKFVKIAHYSITYNSGVNLSESMENKLQLMEKKLDCGSLQT